MRKKPTGGNGCGSRSKDIPAEPADDWVVVGTAGRSSAVEFAGGGILNHRSDGSAAGGIEVEIHGALQDSRDRIREERAGVGRAASECRTIEISVLPLEQS